jgi:RHS repeat-associated protein
MCALLSFLGRRTSLARPNGVATNYQYDNLSRLLSVLHQAGGNTLDGAAYTVDAAGNRLTKSDAASAVTSNYTYDAIYQLTQVVESGAPPTTSETYSFDAVGNILTSRSQGTHTYNDSNELTSTPWTTFTYDNNGNVTNRTDSYASPNFTWDFENRLIGAEGPRGHDYVTTSFKYDPFGRRIEKVSSFSPGTTSIYVYDGDNLVETLDGNGNVVSRYTQGLGIDEPLAVYENGTTSYYHADGLGSVVALTGSDGSVAVKYDYLSFGDPYSASNSLTSAFRYTGREYDEEWRMYYYRARYYDPSFGRFLSEDPITFNGGPNFYPYVGNDPANSVDPLGLFTIRDAIVVHRTLAVDEICDRETAGACTKIRSALVICNCKCSGSGWTASAELRIYGDMYVYNGVWATLRAKPKDRSVVDAASAIAHERNVHISPAIAAVAPKIDALEAKTFKSKEECSKACDQTSHLVRALCSKTLAETREQEHRQ